MNRRGFIALLGAGLFSASVAAAETYADLIVRQLVDQGYANVTVETTLLGRVRIRAEGEYGLREIILNPRTGEILRDLWFDHDGNPVIPGLKADDSDDKDGSDEPQDGGEDTDNSGSGKDGDEDRADEPDPEDKDGSLDDKDEAERDDRDRSDGDGTDD
ncbi:MAG: hypothetical protein ACT4N9_03640 [Paracoccaceae bacterium]